MDYSIKRKNFQGIFLLTRQYLYYDRRDVTQSKSLDCQRPISGKLIFNRNDLKFVRLSKLISSRVKVLKLQNFRLRTSTVLIQLSDFTDFRKKTVWKTLWLIFEIEFSKIPDRLDKFIWDILQEDRQTAGQSEAKGNFTFRKMP